MTICDHCTRVKVGGSQQAPDSRILGILFGVQDGLRVSITDAFELQYEVGADGALSIPPAYVNEKRELHAAVNKDAEVMGWCVALGPACVLLERAWGWWMDGLTGGSSHNTPSPVPSSFSHTHNHINTATTTHHNATTYHNNNNNRYSVGTEISPEDLELHRAMAEWNESPIYLLLVRGNNPCVAFACAC